MQRIAEFDAQYCQKHARSCRCKLSTSMRRASARHLVRLTGARGRVSISGLEMLVRLRTQKLRSHLPSKRARHDNWRHLVRRAGCERVRGPEMKIGYQ